MLHYYSNVCILRLSNLWISWKFRRMCLSELRFATVVTYSHYRLRRFTQLSRDVRLARLSPPVLRLVRIYLPMCNGNIRGIRSSFALLFFYRTKISSSLKYAVPYYLSIFTFLRMSKSILRYQRFIRNVFPYSISISGKISLLESEIFLEIQCW